jgi:hypothetical protein
MISCLDIYDKMQACNITIVPNFIFIGKQYNMVEYNMLIETA